MYVVCSGHVFGIYVMCSGQALYVTCWY